MLDAAGVEWWELLKAIEGFNLSGAEGRQQWWTGLNARGASSRSRGTVVAPLPPGRAKTKVYGAAAQVCPPSAMPNEATFGTVLGSVIAEKRRHLGLSQEELAFRCKRHWTYISQLERGRKSPTVRTLARIAGALDTKASELLREAEGMAGARGVELIEPEQ